MKISAINHLINNTPLKMPNKNNAGSYYGSTEKSGVNSNVYYLPLNFGSRFTVKPLENTKLYQPFKKQQDGLFKKGYFEFIKQYPVKSKYAVNAVREFLFGITANEEAAKSFIEEITANPRTADSNLNVLLNKIGGVNNFKDWYYHKDGYQRAYERYFKKEIFENNNVSVADMVKISPNLMIDAMKLKSLKTTGSQDFIVGEVPAEIGTIEDFRSLTEVVRNSKLVKEFIKFRNFMEDLDSFSIKYPEAKKNAVNPARFAKDFLKSKISAYLKVSDKSEKLELEKQVPFLKYMNTTEAVINGKSYKYSPILRPYSTKLLFSLEPDGAKEKYFVTMEMFNDTKKTCKNSADKENSAMRPDSPYLNAVVDYYLRSNGCENVPEMKFYDYASNAVVYPFIQGEHIKPKGRVDDLGVLFEDKALNKELKPLKELGIFITDCFYENFMKDTKTGKTLIVDNGHAKYSNPLRPGVKMIHMGFADLYGRDFVSLDAGLERARELDNKI